MKKWTLRTLALCIAAMLFLSSAPALFAQEASPNPFATWANQLLQNTPLGRTQAGGVNIVQMVTFVIAAHQASVRQREVADERARRAYQQMSEKRKAELKRKRIRYIAVDTVKDERTSSRAKKTVMVWDTKTGRVASNNAYDVKAMPHRNTTVKVDNYSAEYVGSGS